MRETWNQIENYILKFFFWSIIKSCFFFIINYLLLLYSTPRNYEFRKKRKYLNYILKKRIECRIGQWFSTSFDLYILFNHMSQCHLSLYCLAQKVQQIICIYQQFESVNLWASSLRGGGGNSPLIENTWDFFFILISIPLRHIGGYSVRPTFPGPAA